MLPMKNIRCTILMLLLLCVASCASAQSGRIVRVGWYSFGLLSTYHPERNALSNLSLEDLPGVYGGYTYEYLRMISQMNGWQLRFIPGSITTSLERLEKGEVDLVGGVGKIPEREEKFAFPTNSILSTSIGIIPRSDDPRYIPNDFNSLKDIRIGVVNGTNPFFRVQQWSQERHIPMQFIPYNSFADMYAALDDGEVDALADSLLTPSSNKQVVATIASLGLYFVGNKNNPELIQKLDDTITKLHYLKPGYQESLSAKYLYSDAYNTRFTPDQREQAWLDQMVASGRTLKVSFLSSHPPIEYFDAVTKKPAGIMADIFARIHEQTGLRFEYVQGGTNDAAEGKADIVAAINTDFTWADQHHTMLSQAILDIPIFIVTRTDSSDDPRVARIRNSHLGKIVAERLEQERFPAEYSDYDTVEACITAVSDGRAGRMYVSSYELGYYMSQGRFADLKFQPVPGFSESLSIGISKDADPMLCAVICEALHSLPPAEINNIVLSNTTIQQKQDLTSLLYAHPWRSLLACSLLTSLIGGLLFFYRSNKKSQRLRAQLEETLSSQQALQRMNETLAHQSHYDALTNLPNRRGLNEFLTALYPANRPLILAILDIDRFKDFNDTHGHLAGDAALITVTKLMQQHAIAANTFIARFGGEEFIWVDTHHSPAEAYDILELLRKAIGKQVIFHQDKTIQPVTISIGYAVKTNDEPIDALTQRADMALYQAKSAGRNQVCPAKEDA